MTIWDFSKSDLSELKPQACRRILRFVNRLENRCQITTNNIFIPKNESDRMLLEFYVTIARMSGAATRYQFAESRMSALRALHRPTAWPALSGLQA